MFNSINECLLLLLSTPEYYALVEFIRQENAKNVYKCIYKFPKNVNYVIYLYKQALFTQDVSIRFSCSPVMPSG